VNNMVNYYITIMLRDQLSDAAAETYINTKVSIIYRKKVREAWLNSDHEALASELGIN